MPVLKFLFIIALIFISFFLFLLALMRMFPIVIAAPLLYVAIVIAVSAVTEKPRRFKGFQ